MAAAVLLAALLIVLSLLIGDEAQTSRRQAAWLSGLAPELRYTLGPGPSPDIRFPQGGPFDVRRGYAQLPEMLRRLGAEGFVVTEQVRMPPRMISLIDQGLFAPYAESAQAGLDLLDCRGETLSATRYPERSFDGHAALPPLLVDTLLFIENRGLLDPEHPMRNPAVEWGRFSKAVVDQALRQLDASHSAAGGSTLATQIEKYRHSPGGRTDSAGEKLRQMASASVRAYLGGEQTLPRRRQIVTDYLNTVPLGARAGFGEINGIGDGMWAWYGLEFDAFKRLLGRSAGLDALAPASVLAFKQALSLMVAQRRPAHYLGAGLADLRALTDSHLRLLAAAGVITSALRDAALPLALNLQPRSKAEAPPSFVDRKAVNAMRNRLLGLLGVPNVYALERLDLAAQSTLNRPLQDAVTTLLRSLADPAAAQAAGLFRDGLLRVGDDTSKINFSFTLYERSEHGNLLRVQTDSIEQPFDLNQGARLDLGSTAKLRTLITYLELVAGLHRRFSVLTPAELAAQPVSSRDVLGRWARDHLRAASDKGLTPMLEAAMQRNYAASPNEGFLTGGGLHHFVNFSAADNGRTMPVSEALTRSVNLVFIRMMRDIVQHVMAGTASERATLFDDPSNPLRAQYLARFADKEGRVYMSRFWRDHAGKTAAQSEAVLVKAMRPTAARLAAAFFALEPDGDVAALGEFIARHLPGSNLTAARLASLHTQMGGDRWTLADRAHLANLHPLQLWLAAHLRANPGATRSETFEAGAEARQAAYQWLFKTRHPGAQDRRIRELLEVDAFAEILRAWQRLGYPFDTLTPSYATALGASGDRPAALAELMGLISNGGLRRPVARVQSLQFAAGTPYETRLVNRDTRAEPVLDREVADVVRRALANVVDEGTARRLKGALVRGDGSEIAIGGKTGTGDHRYDTFGAGGKLVSSRVVTRSATLVFYIGERFFGTAMAYVSEPHAAHYSFTSALPVQLLRVLSPVLVPLVEGNGCSGPAADAGPAVEHKLARPEPGRTPS